MNFLLWLLWNMVILSSFKLIAKIGLLCKWYSRRLKRFVQIGYHFIIILDHCINKTTRSLVPHDIIKQFCIYHICIYGIYITFSFTECWYH